MKRSKRMLTTSVIALLLCAAMLVGTTLALFRGSDAIGGNIVTTGKLDVEMHYAESLTGEWKDAANAVIFADEPWQPGHTDVKYVKISNEGNLALTYQLHLTPAIREPGENAVDLAQVIDVYCAPVTEDFVLPEDVTTLTKVGTLAEVMANPNGLLDGNLIPESAAPLAELPAGDPDTGSETTVCLVLKMQEDAGNDYQGLDLRNNFTVQLIATQYTFERGDLGNDYDSAATLPRLTFPEILATDSAAADVVVDGNNRLKKAVTLTGGQATAFVPAGVKLEKGVTTLTLTVSEMDGTTSNITLTGAEEMRSLDVHIEGVSPDNDIPMIITLGQVAPEYLNQGNLNLAHVENGATVPMTRETTLDTVDAHNDYYYDLLDGTITVALATFSEVAVVSDMENAWEGKFDYTWYTDSKARTTEDVYEIANADQLAAFGAIVGGMDGQNRDSFVGKNVTLLSDINLGDADNANASLIFHPIGYHYTDDKNADGTTGDYYSTVNSFEGTFDGQGHTIANFYQNTWEIKGDYDGNYYSDAMGLFGYVVNGTVKNLTVSNFSSDGEYTPTGVIAAYAVNSTFENIAITNCNPRVYNTGNGGIVGIGGNSDDPDTYNLIFTNITIDNSNIITALWGSWDVACGGLVGMFRGAGHVYMTNCHVAAKMDVYNDVCGNYQYYWYRYSGMMVGTNKNMITDDAGYTVPETSKFHAEDCTVHFGTWNDYYYCEFVANSLASYTHDHQFSRVPHSELNFTDSNGNGIIDTQEERESVTGCKHDHKAAGYETTDINGDGIIDSDVLKENNQAVYLPFNQLFTGYGWGVKHIPVYNGENYAFEGITILDRAEATSEVKFEKADNAKESYSTESTVTIGELFKAANIEDKKLSIKGDKVQVTVSPVGEGSTAGGTYTANTTDWTQGTLTFSGTGAATITITDYYFCKPTTINVTITEKVAAEKFETKFTGDFLYRVGNQNTVKLDSLFKAKDGATIGTVDVTIDALSGPDATGTYTTNATWTNGTIQFSGTGMVKVTITDNDHCISTELQLEVVDATNLTSATGTTTGGNFVLLCDVNTSTYVNYWNCTLYGNGFTYSLNEAPTAYNSKQGHGILITKNATLDNLVIVGDVYNSYGAYTSQDYYNTAVDAVGDTVIQNCYIANCAAPVKARSNVTIQNTTLYGGTVANLIITSGTATLENVTTANYDDGRALVGMGIVVHSDATESAQLVLKGTLTQYNFINESKVPTDTYAKNLHNAMFSSDCSEYQFGTSPNRYVNTGIISLTSTFDGGDITDNANTGYEGSAISVNGVDGYVYSQSSTSGSVNNNYDKDTDTHISTTQGAVPPAYSFDYTNKNYVAKTDGSNDYCYEENGKVNISMDAGDTFNWDTSILTIGKGITNYTVSMNGTDYTGKSIAFNEAGDYEVSYTYTDGNNYKLDENGKITTYSVTYTKTVNITVAVVEATTKHAEFTFGSSNTASTTVTVGNNTYVMPNVTETSSTIGSTTVSGQTIYYPIVEIVMSDSKTSHTSAWYAYFPVFKNAVTITDFAENGTGDEMAPYNGDTTTMPSGLSIVGDPTSLFKYQSSSAAGSNPVVKNNILVYSSPSISAKRSEYNTVIQYSYTDNAGATYYYYIGYHAPAQSYPSICVTPDTLVTMADGARKPIKDVAVGEMVLAWNFYTGKYESVPVSLSQLHGTGTMNVLHLYFSDGTELKVAGEHGIFDATLNTFIFIDEDDAANYVGHRFLKHSGNGMEEVTLKDYRVTTEDTAAHTILSMTHYNVILENMLTVTPAHVGGNFFNPFEIGEDLKYEPEAVEADIEKYGLYTYEDFAHVLTREQFEALNLGHFKVSAGKGLVTYEGLIYLIKTFINP